MRARWLIPGALAALAAAPAPAAGGGEDLHACAVIAADTARLACYDRLAGREAAEAPAAPPSAASVPASPATTPAAPKAPPAQVSGAATPTAAAAAPAAQSFGLYAAEHPRPPPVAKSTVNRVVELGTAADGRMTVTLEGGQVWELLDDADPLLAAGDAVTIARATFGSFLMQTPTKRSHRVRRLH